MKKIFGAAVLVILSLAIASTLYLRDLRLDYFSYKDYPVKGVDVSSYQGDIDWGALGRQDIRFAFIKATEGSGHTDPYFKKNFEAAIGAGLRVGAYHFFSYDSSGSTQADNFIATVPRTENMLPPVIDLEFYGDKSANPPGKKPTRRELSLLLGKLENYYGVRPIIYANEKSYLLYIAGAFNGYDIWIRNTVMKPFLGRHDWAFWQYTDKATLEGYKGAEKYIDMNVFNGTVQEFDTYPGN
ncbi:lysozyme [Sporobacter termitidis DSM 10068]|uniref:Lysozyme n=1 Tax=Sporobacter termitidis DSM 10068 TaxID=1123282 RepID=A0A1M5YZ38_9FIRM|nr:GH25 family lysozyme [Sporobacter termitidis]SHI16833.1 lysozyme [Sporobacter termitidis DSM 10068]